MADNVTIPATGTGTTTPVVATDDISGVHYQKIKIALGADGAVDTLLDSGQQLAANSVPVVLASDHLDVKVTLDGEQVAISGTVTVDGSGVTQPISATALPLPSGAATAANQSTGNSLLAGIANAAGATTDTEATGDGSIIAILKRLRTLAGSVVTSLTGILAGFVTEDAAAGASPTGAMAMAVRADDRYGDYTTNEGDAQALRVNYFGELYVMDKNAADLLGLIWTSLGYTIGTDTQTVATNTDTTATNTGNAATSLAVMDDWDESDRAKVNLVPGQAGITGGAGAVAANTPRVTLASDDPSLAYLSNISGNASVLGGLARGEDTAHSSGAVGIQMLAVRRDTPTSGTSADGDYATLNVDSSGRLRVYDNIAEGWLESIAGATGSNGSDSMLVEGAGADHDDPDTGKPVKVGSVAYNFDGTTPGTAVAEGDRVNQIADVYGRQYVETAHPNYWSVSADYASAQTNTSVKAAPGAGLKLYITDIFLSNGATAGNVTLLNGSGGSVVWEAYPGINGGAAPSFRTPIVLSANTALVITSTTVTTHSVTICGYTAP